MKRTLEVVAALSLLTVGSLAHADEKTEKSSLGHEIVAVTFNKSSYDQMVSGVAEQLPPELKDKVPSIMMSYREMSDLQMGLMAKYYSAKEMRELLKFYQSSTGKKMLKVMPEIMEDVQGAVMASLEKNLEKLAPPDKGPPAGNAAPAPAPAPAR